MNINSHVQDNLEFLNTFLKNSIGFDKFAHTLKNVPSNDTYPPYNIRRLGRDHLAIEIATAGFSREDLEVELIDGYLIITGHVKDDTVKEYIYRGLATRRFKKTFVLADTLVVRKVDYHDGVLSINLENVIPEERKPKKIPIGFASNPELLLEDVSKQQSLAEDTAEKL